jgi:hypothetical protein
MRHKPLAIYCAVHHIAHIINQTAKAVPHTRYEMTEQSKIADEFQKASKDSLEAVARSYGDANKGFQAIVSEYTNYSKKAFEDGTRAFEQLVGAKSVEQAIETQSQYVKKAYEGHIAEMTKLGEMYASLVQNAFKPLAR